MPVNREEKSEHGREHRQLKTENNKPKTEERDAAEHRQTKVNRTDRGTTNKRCTRKRKNKNENIEKGGRRRENRCHWYDDRNQKTEKGENIDQRATEEIKKQKDQRQQSERTTEGTRTRRKHSTG